MAERKIIKKIINPLVSVIITTRNSARTLDRCLKSIKDQTYQPIEIILVDNNSTDDTKEIAKKYTSLVFNYGPERSAQRNFGAKKAKGKFFLIHDSDIYFSKNAVKECVEIAEKTNCKAIILPEKSIGKGFWTKVKAFERSFYVGNDLIESARFFDEKAYWQVGGFDEELTGPEDWDLSIRFRKAGYKISRTKSFLLHDEGRVSLKSNARKKRYYAQDFAKYRKKHPEISRMQFNPFYRFKLSKVIIKGISHPILFIGMIIMKFYEVLNLR